MIHGADKSGRWSRRPRWAGFRSPRLWLGLLWLLAAHSLAGRAAQIVLPAYFGNDMIVSSAGDPFVIWGWSDQKSGQVEFQGRTVRWTRTQRIAERGGLRTWEARIDGLTNSPRETLRVVAGEGGLLKKFEARLTLELTNVVVGGVWLWFVVDNPRSPRALLSPAQTNRLWNGCRVLRASSPDAITGWPEELPPSWEKARADTLPASVSFLASLPEVPDRRPGLGIILMPAKNESGKRITSWLYKTPDATDPRMEPMQRAVQQITNDVHRTFQRAANLRQSEINQSKLQGIVIHSPRIALEDMLDFRDIRFLTPPDFTPLRVDSVLW